MLHQEKVSPPPIPTLGSLPPKIVPEGTKVWRRNGTRLAGNPNIEMGGRGQRPTPTSPEDIAQVFQHFRLVRFSKFCPPTEWTAPFLPKNWDDLGTCGKARSRGHRSHRHVGHRSHFGSDYNFSAQAGTVHPAGQAVGQPGEPGETDRGRASPAGQSTI